MSPSTRRGGVHSNRLSPRIHSLREISVDYEGHSDRIQTRPPDISAHGMFINTGRKFPEGAILNLRFRLELSGIEIATRCEVRYCLAGVGVGVEFIRMPTKDIRAIEHEIELSAPKPARPRRAKKK